MFPLQTTAPIRAPPLVTWGLIIANCAIFPLPDRPEASIIPGLDAPGAIAGVLAIFPLLYPSSPARHPGVDHLPAPDLRGAGRFVRLGQGRDVRVIDWRRHRLVGSYRRVRAQPQTRPEVKCRSG